MTDKININDLANLVVRKWSDWYYVPVYVKNYNDISWVQDIFDRLPYDV